MVALQDAADAAADACTGVEGFENLPTAAMLGCQPDGTVSAVARTLSAVLLRAPRLYLATFGNLWQPSATFGKLWQPLAIFGNLWQLLATLARDGLDWNGRSEMVCIGVDWSGLDWSGLGWSGLDSNG